MNISWGYSPKAEHFIPLSNYPSEKYLIILRKAMENLGWDLSHVSASGIIAYTPLSFQSYSEEISVRIVNGFAVVKSECVGMQLLFNDYGKNSSNLERLFHEFEYVQYHLQNEWGEQVEAFQDFVTTQDDSYFEKGPLAVKNKIRNLLHVFLPQKGYISTPIIVLLNVFFYCATILTLALLIKLGPQLAVPVDEKIQEFGNRWVLNRKMVLEGEYWRLIAYQFMHGSARHLFFNMYALIYIGLLIEHKIGWKKFATIYLLSGIFGGLASIAYLENSMTVGSSGAIFGVFGALLAMLSNKMFEPKATKALLLSVIMVVALMLVSGFMNSRVDNACHVGGLLGGFMFTYIFTYDYTWRIGKIPAVVKYSLISFLFLATSFLVINFTPNYQYRDFALLKEEFNENSRGFNEVFKLKFNWPKSDKIAFIERHAIVSSKANLAVIKRMKKLTLNAKDLDEIKFKSQLAEETYATAKLILKDAKSNHQYKKEVFAKIESVQKMHIKFIEDSYEIKREN